MVMSQSVNLSKAFDKKDGRESAFSCDLSEESLDRKNNPSDLEKEPLRIPHEFDSKGVKQIKCNVCLTIQPPQKYCQNCGICFG